MRTKYIRFEKTANGGATDWPTYDFKIVVQMIRRPCQRPTRTSGQRLLLTIKAYRFQLHLTSKKRRATAPFHIVKNVFFNARYPSLNSVCMPVDKPGYARGGYPCIMKQPDISSFDISGSDMRWSIMNIFYLSNIIY